MAGNPYSAVKVFHHKEILDSLMQGVYTSPIYIRLKPTNTCNHHCAYCSYGSGDATRKTALRDSINHGDFIPREKMREIVSDMKDMGVKAVTFSGGGEPLTYPYIEETALGLQENGIDTALISNGQLLCGDIAKIFAHAKWVRISFDSPNGEEYAKLRGVSLASFNKVLTNIHDFSLLKDPDCVLGINYVVNQENYHRIFEAAKLAVELGVNNIKFSPVIENTPHYHDNIEKEAIRQIHEAQSSFDNPNFVVINDYETEWQDKNFTTQSFPVCYACRLVTVIAADQKIYYCQTKAYDSHYIVGDIREKSFKETWFSTDTQKRLRSLHPQNDCKNYCVFEKRNKLMQAYFDVNMKHVNFI